MTVDDKKAAILNALIEERNLQRFVDSAAEIIENPLFIYDVSGKLLAKSQRESDKPVWSTLFPDGYLVFKDMRAVETAGVYHKILHDDAPVLGLFDFFPKRFLGCRIRDKDGVVGVAAIVEMNSFQQGDSELLVTICEASLYELLYQERTAMQITPYFSLLRDIIEHNIQKAEVQERSQRLSICFPAAIRLVAASYADTQNSLSIYFIRESLMALLPGNCCIIYDNMLLLLLNTEICCESTLALIKRAFQGSETWIGISREFRDIMELPVAYDQIKAIKRLRFKIGPKTDVIHYEEIASFHLFETTARYVDVQSFCHPLLDKVQEYDHQNHTELYQSIEAYLENGRNMQKAAISVHLHKNTLYYRLKRAEEYFGIDLSDENLCFHLQISFRMKHMGL